MSIPNLNEFVGHDVVVYPPFAFVSGKLEKTDDEMFCVRANTEGVHVAVVIFHQRDVTRAGKINAAGYIIIDLRPPV